MGRILVTNLSKSYRQYSSRWSRLIEWFFPFFGRRHTRRRVLENINFQITAGEAVGIVGSNGAGKSTLLKIITGTTAQTTGVVVVEGRIAALLELGIGFHPDFTGRQNIYMAGQLLGYDSNEISRLMPDIEAFSEIGDYIDQPVRVYSSGMQMRLAFSLATAKRPDILIVDEALSVGDAYFQHKSFERIRAYKSLGTTLLIVSHDKSAIQAICDRAILLCDGALAMEGDPESVMDYYNATLGQKTNIEIAQIKAPNGKYETVSGSGEAIVLDLNLKNEDNQPIDIVFVGQKVKLQLCAKALVALPELVAGYLIKDRLGQTIFGTNTHHLNQKLFNINSGKVVNFSFSFYANLGPGTYSISVALHSSSDHIGGSYQWRDLAKTFEIVNLNHAEFVGVAWLPPKLELIE